MRVNSPKVKTITVKHKNKSSLDQLDLLSHLNPDNKSHKNY
jgi:hypothetical protein